MLNLSKIVFGTDWISCEEELIQQGRSLLHLCQELGIDTIDTARVYQGGKSEAAIGSFLKKNGIRSNFKIITKCCHPAANSANYFDRISSKEIVYDLELSLKALKVDYVDCLLFHRGTPTENLLDLVVTMNRLLDSGKILSYGFSNWSLTQQKEVVKICKKEGLIPPVLSSPQFSLIKWNKPPWEGVRGILDDGLNASIKFYKEAGIKVLCWSPLARGVLTDKFMSGGINANMDAGIKAFASYPQIIDKLSSLNVIAKQNDITLAELCIAYIFSTIPECSIVTTSKNPRNIESMCQARRVVLDKNDLNRISGII